MGKKHGQKNNNREEGKKLAKKKQENHKKKRRKNMCEICGINWILYVGTQNLNNSPENSCCI